MKLAIVVLSGICIILAGYAAGSKAQLKAEKLKAVTFDSQMLGLKTQLAKAGTDANAKLNEQITVVKHLEISLDKANKELERTKAEIDDLVAQNLDLKSKLDSKENAPIETLTPQ